MNDMKPDISQLTISTSSSGPYPAPGGGTHYIADSGPAVSSTQGYGYGLHQSHSAGSLSGGGYFDSSAMFGGLPAGTAPLQSPILHSQVGYFKLVCAASSVSVVTSWHFRDVHTITIDCYDY